MKGFMAILFSDIKIGDGVHVKIMNNNVILLEGDAKVIDKAPDDTSWQDLRLDGKNTKGQAFVGWFPMEAITSVTPAGLSKETIALQKIAEICKDALA
jgi:hypothetical protein